jgi:hypothetical protein
MRYAWLLLLPLLLGACFGDPQPTGSAPKIDGGPPTCVLPSGQAPKTAPNGYYTNGAAVCSADGTRHMFHGVDRPSLEFCNSENTGCTHIQQSDFALMAGWNANVVRVALDQDRWLSQAALYDPNYALNLDIFIGWIEAVGMDVILDLHWSDRGDLTVTDTMSQAPGNSNQQPMADVNSLEFWKEVSARYRGDGHVLFELYNEPNGVTWDVWLNGGNIGGYTYVGMQQLYDAIRNDSKADNIVIAGGLSYAYDLSGVAANPIQGYNIMYASHPYKTSGAQGGWGGHFGYLAESNLAPVILTEFGDNEQNSSCTGDWDTQLIQYADMNGISWTAWAWYVPGDATLEALCSFPALISDWDATPSIQGVAVKAALAKYPPLEAGAPAPGDAGADADATVDTDGAPGDATVADATPGDATVADGAPGDGGAGDAAALDDASDDAATLDDDAADAGADAATD